MDSIKLFCLVDDFCKKYQEEFSNQSLPEIRRTKKIGRPKKRRKQKNPRKSRMSLSEIMFIIIMYSFSPCKNFKFYYLVYVKESEFPGKLSYNHFVSIIHKSLHPLAIFSKMLFGTETGKYFIDSTPLEVCKNKRRFRHKVFDGFANSGMTSKGWFFGFKLHFIINEKGEVMNYSISKGSTSDLKPVLNLSKNLIGFLFADKGYIDYKKSGLFQKLYQRNLKLVTGIKSNMKNKLQHLEEKLLLRKRGVIESVFNVLKNVFNIEHSRHRNPINAFTQIIATIVAYLFKANKPKITDISNIIQE